ncbi:MAG: LCP family protein, partial [Oscillospiraceae bacterium]|nr:LCP family protein [Oscillospiraceae bacterium]
MKQYDGNNIDDLLIDVKNLLEEDRKPVVQRERTLRQKMETEREAERIAEIMRGAAEHAERETRAYGHQRETRPFEPVRDVEEAETPRQRVVAYNTDFSDNRFRENFQPRRQEEMPRHNRPQPQERAPKKKKRGSGCLTFLLLVIVLIGIAVGALMFFGTLTRREAPFERKEGMSSVLIAGTDAEGLRTDTLMLVSIDEKERIYNVMSIPRDTLTYAPYSVPKINAAYGYYGCGEEG